MTGERTPDWRDTISTFESSASRIVNEKSAAILALINHVRVDVALQTGCLRYVWRQAFASCDGVFSQSCALPAAASSLSAAAG